MEIVEEIAIEPCYHIYRRLSGRSLMALHTLFEEYTEKEHNGDRATQIQAWHYLQAVVQQFRDRCEWDEENSKPKPYFALDVSAPFYKKQCDVCKVTLTFDFPEWRKWNGYCSCCGSVLEPEIAERIA